MLLADPGQTAFDLRFRLFGASVRVHPLFWLLMAFFGYGAYGNDQRLPGNGLGALALWVGCCFVSILLHEFGHVFAFRAFGNDAHILLFGFGGLAMADGASAHRWQRIAVSAAGPAIQLALWAALVGMIWAGVLPHPLLVFPLWCFPPLDAAAILEFRNPLAILLEMLLYINLFWALLNILPVWPLDGGQICREVCQGISRRRGTVISLWISVVVSAVLAINSVLAMNGRGIPYLPAGGMYTALFFAMFAVGSYQAIQEEQSRRRGWEEKWPWDR